MLRKGFFVVTAILLLISLQACTPKPEQSLLKSYFHAIMLNDLTTMSTMALEPIAMESTGWKILTSSEEKIEDAFLPGLTSTELDLKKKLEEHVGPTLDAKDAMDAAEDTYKATRTKAARTRWDEAKAAYETIRNEHNDLQKNYNDAKAAAAREEEITKFSLSGGDVTNVRELTGKVHSKQVEVRVTNNAGQAKDYRFYLRQYDLRDEAAALNRRGRWIILRIEPMV